MTSETRSQLLEQIRALLGEHAEGFVVMLQVEGEEEESEVTLFDWGGGFTLCLGLARRMDLELEKVARQSEGSPPDDGEEWRASE